MCEDSNEPHFRPPYWGTSGRPSWTLAGRRQPMRSLVALLLIWKQTETFPLKSFAKLSLSAFCLWYSAPHLQESQKSWEVATEGKRSSIFPAEVESCIHVLLTEWSNWPIRHVMCCVTPVCASFPSLHLPLPLSVCFFFAAEQFFHSLGARFWKYVFFLHWSWQNVRGCSFSTRFFLVRIFTQGYSWDILPSLAKNPVPCKTFCSVNTRHHKNFGKILRCENRTASNIWFILILLGKFLKTSVLFQSPWRNEKDEADDFDEDAADRYWFRTWHRHWSIRIWKQEITHTSTQDR